MRPLWLPSPIPTLPDIGNPAGTIANLNDEFQIGRMVIHEMRDQNYLLEDPEASDYIQTLGLRLSSQAPDSEREFHYYVVREGDINAEALPGASSSSTTAPSWPRKTSPSWRECWPTKPPTSRSGTWVRGALGAVAPEH